MSRSVLLILALSAALLAAPAASEEMMDPLALIRKTLKYWHRIYETYREEVALGYCWADYLLGIEESISEVSPHRDIMGDPFNSTSRDFDKFHAVGTRGSSHSIRLDGKTFPGRSAELRSGLGYRGSYRVQSRDYRDAERFLRNGGTRGNYTGEAVDPGRTEGPLNLVQAGLRGIREVFNIQQARVGPGDRRRPGDDSSDTIVRIGETDKPGPRCLDKFCSDEFSEAGSAGDKNAERNDQPGFLKSNNYPEEAFRKSADGITARRLLYVKSDPPGDTSFSSSSSLDVSPEKQPPYEKPLSRRKATETPGTLSGPKFKGNGAEDDREVSTRSGGPEKDTPRKVLYSMMSPAASAVDRSFEERTFSLKLSAPGCRKSLDNRRFPDRTDAKANGDSLIKYHAIRGNHPAEELFLNDETTDASAVSAYKSDNFAKEESPRRRREAGLDSKVRVDIGFPSVQTDGFSETQSNLKRPLINNSPDNLESLNSTRHETELRTNYKPQLGNSGRNWRSVEEGNLEMEQSPKLLKTLLNLTNQDKKSWEDYQTKPQLDIPQKVNQDKTKAVSGMKQPLERWNVTLNPIIKNLQGTDAETQSGLLNTEQKRLTFKKQLLKHPKPPLTDSAAEQTKTKELRETKTNPRFPSKTNQEAKTNPTTNERQRESAGKPKTSKSKSSWKPSEPPLVSGYPTIERWADYKAKTQSNPPTPEETRAPTDSRISSVPNKHLSPFTPVNNRRGDPPTGGSLDRRLFVGKSAGVGNGEKKEERSPGGGSSLPGVRKRRFMADYGSLPGGTSRNPRPSRSSGTGDQGRRSSNIVPEARGPLQTTLPDLRAAFMTVSRMFGLFIRVGRQIMAFVEGNKLLSCTWDYLWTKIIEWIDG